MCVTGEWHVEGLMVGFNRAWGLASSRARRLCARAARAPDGKRTRHLPYFLFSHKIMHSNHERAHTGHFVWDMAHIEPRKSKRKPLCQIGIQRPQSINVKI